MYIIFDYRGESFREVFLQVGELRSLVLPNVKVMALTATISQSSRLFVQRLLGMHNPNAFTISPCKANIVYSVVRIDSLYDDFSPLLKHLKEQRLSTHRSIIFCRTMDDCANLFFFFQEKTWKMFCGDHRCSRCSRKHNQAIYFTISTKGSDLYNIVWPWNRLS